MERNIYKIGKELFITSDEEIKEGDWCLDKFNQRWKLENKKLIAFDSQGIKRFSTDNILGHECKKIILTTNQDLIKDGVQSIPDEFLKWFVKNPSFEYIPIITTIVNKESLYKTNIGFESWRKEEHKQGTLEESNETTAIRFLEWYRLKKVIYQFHCYHIPNINDENWKTTVFRGNNSYLNSHQLFEIFKKENYEK